jgi:hypothetical protein
MSTPIEQAAQQAAQQVSDPYFGVAEQAAAVNKPNARPNWGDFDLAALSRSQNDFIEALFDYAQTKDVHALLEAQTSFIQAQALTLHQLGIL